MSTNRRMDKQDSIHIHTTTHTHTQRNTTQPKKRMKFCYMQKRQIMYGFTYMRNIKNKKAKVPDRTDKWLLEVRGGKGRGVKWVKGGQNVQTSTYRISKSWGCDTIVVQSLSCVQLCMELDCSTPGSCVLHYLTEFAQIHVC